MFRAPFKFQDKSAAKWLRTPALAALMAIGIIFTPMGMNDTLAGSSGQSEGHFKGKSSGSKIRTIRLGGENLSLRPVSRIDGAARQAITGKRLSGSGERIYSSKKSVLDGHYGEVVSRHSYGHGSRFDNIRRYGKIEYGSSVESRAGVLYQSGQQLRTKRGHHGLQEIAGGNQSGIVSHRLIGGERSHKYDGRRFTKGELIAIGIAVNSYYEIAGSGQGAAKTNINDNCSYGTYCTINLGGPKIITYNDTGDIKDGALADETLSDEEYQLKYGTK